MRTSSDIIRSTLVGGAVVGVLDGLDAVIAYKAVLGFDPVSIYQFVASGVLAPAVFGPLYGVFVWAFMNHVVIALSKIPPAAFSLPLFVNGIVGHALFVGVPVAVVARHYLKGRREELVERPARVG